jgi:hypothetical protein
MRFVFVAGARLSLGVALCLALLLSAESNPLPAQPPKDGPLPPINQAAVDEAVARAVEYLQATQKDDGTWSEGGHPVGCTALTGIALIEAGVRSSDAGIIRAANHVRSKAYTLTDTYQTALAILFLDRLKDPKRDSAMIQVLAARLMAGQTQTGGWNYEISGGPRQLSVLSTTEANTMIAALKKMTPPPVAVQVSYRERPSRMGLCIKESDDIIVKPSQGFLDAAEYEKKRAAIIKDLPTSLKHRIPFKEPVKWDALDGQEKKAFLDKEKGDNSNTHFAMIGLWAARRHGVPTERTFTLVARRFRTSEDPSAGGWAYSYPQSGSTPAMTSVALLGLAIGNALAVDPEAGRPEKDQAILKSLAYLSKNVGMPTGKFTDRPKVKDAGGLYYFWALERIAVLYDISTLDKKDWYRWGAEILIGHQETDGSWTDGGFPGGEKGGAVCTPLAVLFLKRANLTPDLSKRLIIDSSALTARVNEPKVEPPPPPPPPKVEESPPKVDPPKKKEEPPPAPVMPPKVEAPPSEPAPVKKESAPIWPWLVGGLGIVLAISLGLVFALRKKSDDEEDEEDEKPKKKAKKLDKGDKGAKPKKALKAKRAKE